MLRLWVRWSILVLLLSGIEDLKTLLGKGDESHS
jgi:hypothetical protein